MKKILCFLGLHKLDMDTWRVINMFGDCNVTCKWCEATEIVDSDLVSNYLLYRGVKQFLKETNL